MAFILHLFWPWCVNYFNRGTTSILKYKGFESVLSQTIF
jgi:hypothetical protein